MDYENAEQNPLVFFFLNIDKIRYTILNAMHTKWMNENMEYGTLCLCVCNQFERFVLK